jgi:hypothetical protein
MCCAFPQLSCSTYVSLNTTALYNPCCCRRLLDNGSFVLCRYNQSGVTTLRFEADYSSLLHFSSAECVVELDVTEDKVIEVPVPANETDAAAANAADAAGDKDAATKDAAADKADGKDAAAAADKEEADAEGSEKSKDEQQDEGAEAKKEDGSAADGEAVNATDAATAVHKTVFVKKTIQVTRRKVFHVSRGCRIATLI